jgi:small conductance mechanosensitive channel
VVLVLSVLLARLVRRGVEAALRRTSTEAYVHLLVAKLAHFGIVLLGVVAALSLAGANLSVLVASLGLATVALGFALQDIASNFVAGIVLLLEHPFTKGDMIAVNGASGASGVVEDIRVRATQLRTVDGQLVLVPNKLLFTNVLTNSSATMRRRLEVTVDVPYAQDSSRVRELLLASAAKVDGVGGEDPPRLLTKDFGQGTLQLRLLFWVDPRRTDLLRVRSEVLEAAEAALAAEGIDLTPPQALASPTGPPPPGGAPEGPKGTG